jgi:hypothetical protein
MLKYVELVDVAYILLFSWATALIVLNSLSIPETCLMINAVTYIIAVPLLQYFPA